MKSRERQDVTEPRATEGRVPRAMALAASAFLAILAARAWAAPLGQWLFDHGRGRAVVPAIAVMKTTPSIAFEVHVATFALVATSQLLCGALLFALRTRPLAQAFAAVSLCVAAGLTIGACLLSTPLVLVAAAAVGAGILGAAAASPARSISEDERRDTRALVVASACTVSAWACWITLGAAPASAGTGAVGALAFIRSALRGAPQDDRRFLSLVPLFFLPLLGLLRAPSFGFVVLAAASGLALDALARRHPPPRHGFARGLVTLALASLVATLVVPTRFRELDSLNHQLHEAGTFAWANAIAHGRLMMADAGLLYGPLRAYVTAGLAALLGGLTAEHLRQAQVLANVIAAGTFLAMGAWLTRGRVWALAWLAYLTLVATPLSQFLDYRNLISFGWADLGRIVFPIAATTAALRCAALGATRTRLAVSGGAMTLAALYGQEFWSAIAVSFLVGTLAHVAATREAFVARRARPLPMRVFAGRVAMILSGAGASAVLVCVPYAARGKLSLFLATIGRSTRVFASGHYASRPFPVGANAIDDASKLLEAFSSGAGGGAEAGLRIEFLVPPAIYGIACVVLATKLLERRWSARATLQTALTAFGVIAFGVATNRSDYVHLLAATPPALLLAVSLAADATDRAVPRALRALASGVVAVAFVASLHGTGFSLALAPRVASMLRGEERPSAGAPYVHPDLPRAGDVFVPPDLEALAVDLRRRTGPDDAIFVNHGFTAGGEVYFLADRPNASRFDLLCEILVEDDRAELWNMFERGEPRYVIGADAGMIGLQAYGILATRWAEVARHGPFVVLQHGAPRRRSPHAAQPFLDAFGLSSEPFLSPIGSPR